MATTATELRIARWSIACWLAIAAIPPAAANPWAAPGNDALRSDVQRLADAGILRGPVTSWPLSWPDIARDVLAATADDLDLATAGALLRVQRAARVASSPGFDGAGARVSGAHQPSTLRRFADSPREEGEVSLRAGWLGEHVAINLQGAYVADPDDDRSFRPDGSYVGVNVGNFMISAGYFERWWGPGWDGSLILSTNARPIPSLTLERNYSDPFKSRLLSWIGPWRASIAVGEAESHDVPLPKVRFLAARVTFKPRTWLEFGISRTAQWCGGDRPCDMGTFTDMLLGRDNEVENGSATLAQPGNQMAGYDMRLRSPWRPLPLAFYTQLIGEDEAGGLPSKFLGLVGLEAWGSGDLGGWTVHAEYADTTCNFTRQTPQYDCAYRNSIYPQGYAYRGRLIGHAMDNDSRMYTVAGLLNRPNGDTFSIAVRRTELNRNGGPHALSDVPLAVDDVELRFSRVLGAGKVNFGVGYEDPGLDTASSSRVRGFVVWQQGF